MSSPNQRFTEDCSHLSYSRTKTVNSILRISAQKHLVLGIYFNRPPKCILCLLMHNRHSVIMGQKLLLMEAGIPSCPLMDINIFKTWRSCPQLPMCWCRCICVHLGTLRRRSSLAGILNISILPFKSFPDLHPSLKWRRFTVCYKGVISS